MRKLLAAAAVFVIATSPAYGAPCRTAGGKFVKCPTPAPAKPAVRCKLANGKFAKCGTPGAKPA